MALSITLSPDVGTTFTPGSIVLGVVKLTTHKERIIDSLNIDFRGVTTVSLNLQHGGLMVSRADDVSESYLLSRQLGLCRGEYIHQNGTYTWPFAFRIPLFAASRAVLAGSKEWFPPKHPWKGDQALDAHPLPPSMKQSGKFACTVQYGLEATLVHRSPVNNHPNSKSQKLQASRMIFVQSMNMSTRTHSGGDWPCTIHHHTLYLPLIDSSYRSIRRLFRGFSRNGRHDESEAKLAFSIFLPKELEMKKQQTLSILMSCTTGTSTKTQGVAPLVGERCPNLLVYSFQLSLVQHTQVRTRSHTESSVKHLFFRKGSCTVPISSQTAPDSLTSFVNLGDTSDLSIPTGLLAVDFSTYNIARFHSLEVFICIKHQEKKHKVTLRDIPLRIVPQSGRELELGESVEEDEENGRYLTSIRRQEHRGNISGTGRHAREFLQAVMEGPGGDGALNPETPPPEYTA